MLQLTGIDKYIFSGSDPICNIADAIVGFKYPDQDHKISRCARNIGTFESLKGSRKAFMKLFYPKIITVPSLTAESNFADIKKISKQPTSTKVIKQIASMLGRISNIVVLANDLDLMSWSPSETTSKVIDLMGESTSLIRRLHLTYSCPKTANPKILKWKLFNHLKNLSNSLNILGIFLRDHLQNRLAKLAWSLSAIFLNYFIFSQKKILKKTSDQL